MKRFKDLTLCGVSKLFDELLAQIFKIILINLVKCRVVVGVHIKNSEHVVIGQYKRHHDLGDCRGGTCNMMRDIMHIFNQLCSSLERSRATHAACEVNVQATMMSLVGANDEVVLLNMTIKPRPVKVLKAMM